MDYVELVRDKKKLEAMKKMLQANIPVKSRIALVSTFSGRGHYVISLT